ncbi:MAG: class I SAM-dependent methyltransferase [Verrucomicrobia bacterium]|nr:class I SAM-dependent methyltransferase [Verrucomicrobiota bacterium]MBV8279996.1 class I SAM-dependent methyltransferase [Verrucomicrobiota bacterium]
MSSPRNKTTDSALGRPEWFEDERFWESTYPFIFPKERFAAAEAEVAELAKLTGSPFRQVLDLCCGPGRHSIPLARQGARVTAVDRSPFLLDKARSRAESEKLGIEWVEQDMRLFVRPEAFDLAINLFTSFGYFGDEEDLTVLRNVFCSLTPGGFFIIDVLGKEIIARGFAPSAVEQRADGSIWVQTREIIDDWYRIRSRWFLIRDDKVTEAAFDTALYSGRELANLLKQAGFDNVKLFGSLQGIPYDLQAQRLVAVAQKQ